jgi:hypothetical protein
MEMREFRDGGAALGAFSQCDIEIRPGDDDAENQL